MNSWRIIQGDCLEKMRELPAESIDAIVTDPPYGLTGASRNGSPRNNDPSTPFRRTRLGERGFMGQVWDAKVPGPEIWAEALRACKPGAHLAAFGGTRRFHRLMCAIEDAGWILWDTALWLYGEGYPKAKNSLKPAWEPIVLGRKPMIGSLAANLTEHGTGGLDIDGCRIATDDKLRAGTGKTFETLHAFEGRGRDGEASAGKVYADKGGTNFAMKPGPRGGDARGRWPANVLLDEESAAMLDKQTGKLTSGVATKTYTPTLEESFALGNKRRNLSPASTIGDSGGASRFFYCSKASRAERGDGNTHPTVKPLDLMQWLCRLIVPAGGTVLDPFMGSGSTGIAALRQGLSFIGIEQDPKWCDVAERRIHDDTPLFHRVSA